MPHINVLIILILRITCSLVNAQSCPIAGDTYCQSLDTLSCRWTGCVSCINGFCNCACVHPCCGQHDLPGWCFTPPGNDCYWYEKCLAKRFPECTGTKDDYAVAFGKKYCEIYSDRYGSGPSASALSQQGYQWFDATRKCLQQQLVELLRYPNSTNCKKIKEAAFKSHPGCYVNPQIGAPGICKLSPKDWFNIFRVTSSALTTEPAYYISQAWAVAISCGKEFLQKGTRKIRTLIQSLGRTERRNKRFAPGYDVSNETLEQFYHALRLAESMSRLLQWDRTVMDYIAIPLSSSEIDIVLIDTYELNLITKPDVLLNLDNQVKSFSDATASGKLSQLEVEGKGKFRVTQMEACGNDNCTEVYLKTKYNSAWHSSASFVSLNLAGSFALLILYSYHNIW